MVFVDTLFRLKADKDFSRKNTKPLGLNLHSKPP